MAMAGESSGKNTGYCDGDFGGKIKRKVGLIYDEKMCKHDTPNGEDHPECPDRIRVIWERLQLAGVSQRCVVLGGSKVEDKHLQLVHSQDHVNLVKKLSTKQRDYRRNKIASKLDSIYLNGGSSEAAYLAAGSVVKVAEKVAEGELDCGFAIVRPPGHHAEPHEAMGFCLFNNVAVAATYLLNERPDLGIKKILIVDWDVHHGNGTQKMFWNDPRVLLFSVHRHDNGSFYPGGNDGYYDMVGEGPGEGFNINVPWEQEGCGDADYFAAWDYILLPVANEFKPDIVLLSAGFDSAIDDPLGGCLVTPYGYSVMLMKLMVFAQGKIVMALEGGYNLDSIAKSSLACVQVLLEQKPIQGSCETYPFESTWRVIQAVRKRLCAYWPSLVEMDDYHQPPKLFFTPSEYGKAFRLGSKCSLSGTIKFLKDHLSKPEQQWFKEHPQFKHLWHMPTFDNHKLHGISLLVLRKADLKDTRVCLFVVNGFPIRYSIREHGLLSGLFCHRLEKNLEQFGDTKFIIKIFGSDENITVSDVKRKLISMTATKECLDLSHDRLKLGVLVFLSKVIDCPNSPLINPFILGIVDDLEACENFPWGTYTFDACLNYLSVLVTKDNKAQWIFPGFIIPLEVLAFEAIENLKREFLEPCLAEGDCPRICKFKWKKPDKGFKGYTLENLYKKLGETKEITSFLEPEQSEIPLMTRIMDDVGGYSDEWDKWMRIEKVKIFWEDLYISDTMSRKVAPEQQEQEDQAKDTTTVVGLKRQMSELAKNVRALQEDNKRLNLRCEGNERKIIELGKMILDLQKHPYDTQDRDLDGQSVVPLKLSSCVYPRRNM